MRAFEQDHVIFPKHLAWSTLSTLKYIISSVCDKCLRTYMTLYCFLFSTFSCGNLSYIDQLKCAIFICLWLLVTNAFFF